MHHVCSPSGATVSYEQDGQGPPLVLVHGSFTDHRTNWQFVKPMLAKQFTVYSIARRGRGETDATEWHGVMDEAGDVGAVVEVIDEPVSLLGHSYGAHMALAAAMALSSRIAKLVLYEPPRPDLLGAETLRRLEELARAQRWESFVITFFRDTLLVPETELEALQATSLWPPIVADAKASLGDMRALANHRFDLEKAAGLGVPVMLQFGSESPRELFLTDALASVLPNVQVEELAGQAHEGMTTNPEQYVQSVSRFLLS
ncbi:alpha/beta hydrolase [Halomonas campisalis]|uniref:Alpha/beta hydrolase n=1 Tax=Billgrantia campisalis TaxID=74661 RepID=A0ABS9P869_9GAMM|nr:alpha/beta hydrolase [Halomonas campisalis]MCG6657977.1 alpha/beta hydrolase [Halomonas campisalis]MDR5863498.1 alpha/beta hydrolase [Halomonas campisalis]